MFRNHLLYRLVIFDVCARCGKTGLTFKDQDEQECLNTTGMTQDESLLKALEGKDNG